MTPFQEGLRHILADRHSPEAAAFYNTLLKYIHQRVASQARHRWNGLIGEPDQEEILGEVLYQLMQGGLVRFRGDSLPELLGFVRTITDRTTWRLVERRLREREAFNQMTKEASNDLEGRYGSSSERGADHAVDWAPESPLPDDDRRYLEALIHAGSKAELARRHSISRAAVTQRVQRIQDRIAAMSARDRAAHEAWMQRQAASAMDDQRSLSVPLGRQTQA